MKTSRFNFKLKTLFAVLFMTSVFIFTPHQAEAQFLKKLQKHAEEKIKKEAEKRAENRIDKKIDKSFDSAEDILDGKKQNNNDPNQQKNTAADNSSTQNSNKNNEGLSENQQQTNKPDVVWAKYDFIPGDEVIYEDGPSADEENGEFPSRWDLVKGQVEVARVDGENVIMFIDGMPEIVPYLKNAKEDYLPDVFTIEFDFYRPANGNRITVYLYDDKNQKIANHNMYMDISHYRIDEKLSGVNGYLPNYDEYTMNKKGRWIHVSIAFTKGKLKAYMDDTRLINIPHYEGNPSGLTLQAYFADLDEDKPFYFKNIRIAKGGVKYYDRVLSEGKIIVNGIKFDVNKATLKPESMGPINGIFDLMQKNPELNFSVEGHTDSDGDEQLNQKLSEARAKTVMEQLISMGIAANRLKSTGFGESKPIDNNSTPEGKANNRRVEFVKFTGSASYSNSSNGNPAFDKLDVKTIRNKLETIPNERVQITSNGDILLDVGTIILYQTSAGNLGKMEILNLDKNDYFKPTVKYITYKPDGSVYSQSNHFDLTGGCDLDKGNTKDVAYADEDLDIGRDDATSIVMWQGQAEKSQIRVFTK